MGNSRDENTQDEFPELEPDSDASSSGDFDVATNAVTDNHSGSSDRKIGRYRLLHPIGEGGMGVVWRAIQEHPVKRDVALKLVRKDLGKDSLARFDAERQAIAMMDHPNIAKILDADTTKDGAPYFVMELVKGIPFDQYCNNRKLGIEERLRLMLPVCRAVQHAHQKAIIHRDLKHSNILVAENDDQAIPKVIDFGLAKALGSQKMLTDQTVYTEFGKVVGTIYYMSPEQADSDGMDIDTRSDIFSLGVVLYKLLTGRTPIQMEGDAMSVIGAIKVIREKDAVAPSIAIRNNPDCANWVIDNTSSNPDRFAEKLKGDLDSIVLKALEKDRRSRYETASGLALDIERYLNHETVLAQPRSAVYSVKKFVQRNRGLVASLVTIASLLVVGIVATTFSLMFAIQETARANDSAKIAKQETARAKMAEARSKESEKLTRTQLIALQQKSAWSDWGNGNSESALQTLKQIDSSARSWISRYLANEMYTCKAEDGMYGHTHYVLSLDVSSKGDFVVSGDAHNAVYLWDARNNTQIYRRILEDIVVCVRFSKDQQHFAVADRSNIVSIFETSSGKVLRTFGPFEQDVSSLSFHPQQKILAFGFFGNDSFRGLSDRDEKFEESQPADLLMVNFENGETLQTIKGHPSEITSVEFDGKGDRLASGCMDGKLRIWGRAQSEKDDPDSKPVYELSHTINAHPMGIRKIDLSEDGKRVVSCGNDKIASIWDADTGLLESQLVGHTSKVLGVDLAPSGQLVATSSNDQTAIVWDLAGSPVATWQGHAGPVNEVRFSVDSQQIITASDDTTLRRWSTKQAGKLVTRDFQKYEIWRADFSPDNSMVAVAGENGIVSLIDSKTGELKKELPHDGNAVLSLAWLSDGRLVTAGNGMGVWVWDRLDRSSPILAPAQKYELPGMIWDICVASDGTQILFASGDGTARIFDSESFEEVGVLRGHEEGLASARFSLDGKHIVTASDDKTIRVWDAKTFEHLKTYDQHIQPVWRAVCSPTDANLFASSSVGGKIYLWNLAENEPLPVVFEGHISPVAGLSFTADGRCLVSASDDGTIRVWDVETGVDLFVFQTQPPRPMIHASFSNDGQSLVTTGVGLVNIRHASSEFTLPYLNRDAIADTIKSEARVHAEDATDAELEETIRVTQKVCRYYPTYGALFNLGTAQFRLDRFAEAIDSLKEAMRLEQMQYGMPDDKPLMEGYLAISYAKTGNAEKASEMQKAFELAAEQFPDDKETKRLRAKLQAAMGN